MSHPSERVVDGFRSKNYGKVDMPANSKRVADSSFFIDQSRLGTHEEYDPEAKNDWGGTGKFVEKPNSIMDNVRSTMGGIGCLGSYKSVHEPVMPTNLNEPCCPSMPTWAGRNPLTTRRGE